MNSSLLAQLYAFVVGACLGSFLNVCIVRWPAERSVLRPRSRCTRCGNQLSWYENVPIVSWTVLRGRCRCCDESISPMYPIVELTVALGWLAAVHFYGPTFTAARVATFGTVLLGVAMTDAQHYLIPDGFTLFGLLFAIGTSITSFLLGETTMFASPYDSLVGACAGAGMIAIVGWIGEIMTKREAMGLGDVTLMAFVGAALGPQRALVTVFVGALLGCVAFLGIVMPMSLIRRGSDREQTELALGTTPVETPLVPFGVFLAPAALLTLFVGDPLLAWLLRS